MMKIVRLRFPLSEAPRLSWVKSRLRHNRRHRHLSLLNDLKYVYSFFCSVAGSSTSSLSSPNFPNCFSPRKSALVFTEYLISHFSVFSQRPCLVEPQATVPSFAEPRTLRSLILLSAPPSTPLNFLRVTQTFPRPLPLTQIKLPIPC